MLGVLLSIWENVASSAPWETAPIAAFPKKEVTSRFLPASILLTVKLPVLELSPIVLHADDVVTVSVTLTKLLLSNPRTLIPVVLLLSNKYRSPYGSNTMFSDVLYSVSVSDIIVKLSLLISYLANLSLPDTYILFDLSKVKLLGLDIWDVSTAMLNPSTSLAPCPTAINPLVLSLENTYISPYKSKVKPDGSLILSVALSIVISVAEGEVSPNVIYLIVSLPLSVMYKLLLLSNISVILLLDIVK